MIIKKILNNNFAIVQYENREMVVMGIGISFGKKVGDSVEPHKVKQTYHLSTSEYSSRLIDLIADVPYEFFLLSEEIFEMIQVDIGKRVSDFLFLTLTDHLFSIFTRSQENIYIPNSLLPEIQTFYPDEYKLGLNVVKLINKKLNLTLDEEEGGFIALHIVNATIDAKDTSLSYRITKLIKEILQVIDHRYPFELDTSSLYYYRLVSHLRLLGQRIFSESEFESTEHHDELLTLIKTRYSDSYKTSQLIADFIKKTYSITLLSEELMYLTIHIERIVNEVQKREGNHE